MESYKRANIVTSMFVLYKGRPIITRRDRPDDAFEVIKTLY
jgi:hypothetical protein